MKYSKILSLLLCSFLLVNLVSSADKVSSKISSKGTYNGPTKSTTNLGQSAKINGDGNNVNQNINLATTNSGTTSESSKQDASITGNNNQITQDLTGQDNNNDASSTTTQTSSFTGDDNKSSQNIQNANTNSGNAQVSVTQTNDVQGNGNTASQTIETGGKNSNGSTAKFSEEVTSPNGANNSGIHLGIHYAGANFEDGETHDISLGAQLTGQSRLLRAC